MKRSKPIKVNNVVHKRSPISRKNISIKQNEKEMKTKEKKLDFKVVASRVTDLEILC